VGVGGDSAEFNWPGMFGNDARGRTTAINNPCAPARSEAQMEHQIIQRKSPKGYIQKLDAGTYAG